MAHINPTTVDDDLSTRFHSFHLTEEEQHEVALTHEDIKASEEECRTSLFGKIISQKQANFGGLKTTMELVRGNPKNFLVLEIGNGIYQFILHSETDVIRILNGKPWFFNNHFLNLQRWNPDLHPSQYCFNLTPDMGPNLGLPIQYMSIEVGLKLGAKIGSVDDVSIPATGSKQGRCVRVRVHIDITMPLKRGCMVKMVGSSPFWAKFRYERLPTFCRYCGMVGHDLHGCVKRFFDIDNNELKDCQYGEWIRASPAVQSGQRKPNAPPADARSSEESSMAGSRKSGAKGDGQSNHSISKPVSKDGEAGIAISKSLDLAHEELVTESRLGA